MIKENSNFLLVSIISHDSSEEESFNSVKELIDLVESFEGRVVDIVLQNRETHDKGNYIGSGKVSEIGEIIKDKKIDVVVLNDVVKAGQLYGFTTVFEKVRPGIQVWDRVDLILHIFSKRAFTAEAKLQIELASMRHMGPRIFGMGIEMSRQGGGIGTRGIGQTNTERMKQHWRVQIKKVQERIDKLVAQRQKQIDKRRENGLRTVSLVGYTNAGKTSLFNLLCHKKKYVKNELFATLESYSGKLYLPNLKEEVLVTDTIGFIANLPPELIEAFNSTLLESINSDLLVEVIDISDRAMEEKVLTIDLILEQLGIKDKPRLSVFNKIDRVKQPLLNRIQKTYHKTPSFISVKAREGLEELIRKVEELLLYLNYINR